ncbi:PDF receptor [Caerostris extrusa]|uniref:PDF receptor n=1 Tax=Caerostris extrusa TaxID=172846 RepID=A0AAV4VIU8_CAEEX|nr:PDF receptor [Caerostris extrusa]
MIRITKSNFIAKVISVELFNGMCSSKCFDLYGKQFAKTVNSRNNSVSELLDSHHRSLHSRHWFHPVHHRPPSRSSSSAISIARKSTETHRWGALSEPAAVDCHIPFPVLLNVSYKHNFLTEQDVCVCLQEWLCRSVLVLQMYSGMASINWMFVEGLLLHSRVTVHIFKQDAPFKLYYSIGWGIPALCIGSWSWLMYMYHDTSCWSGYGDLPYIWIITGPMLAALLAVFTFQMAAQYVTTEIVFKIIVTEQAFSSSSGEQRVPGGHHSGAGDETTRQLLYGSEPSEVRPLRRTAPSEALPLAARTTRHQRESHQSDRLAVSSPRHPPPAVLHQPERQRKTRRGLHDCERLHKSPHRVFLSILYCFMNNDKILRKEKESSRDRRKPGRSQGKNTEDERDEEMKGLVFS